ncbi:crotonase/enoyl-CoA hydratase family protein [Verminephrobacter eiseniae]|uniref:Short chain enoyl-CoA hydratase n=1 Tax=Verminephrobacter eiseniae (strain EF01-2) TaxID=391735 RepID=A1WPK5_VEREI|nr:crotonase/enoyl-CoA hydratase family protein [Verminephrobacter eiseniae]ABM59562.1 short chain enoyl-CoA hydratase [Verminephrobacter eiseniae EF01-2]MCW5231010.1 enoyl-CoA hydratase [Verminephrobacter eiseniae]MCW5285082.1 enoyl-CoA hydratase [Verminephrobacter eiseniae]MCW5292743.1 enoyl-CoA hydratase [Verminephrobacter eiseniae]MCW5302790.1 enoyl-CoA hydratase [Verminephrobacter eiseniae]
MSEAQSITTQREGGILIITINRPEARNAFDLATSRQMQAVMDMLDADDSLFVGIITGAGGTFCAGADLKAVARGERPATPERGGFGMFSKPSTKPLIAAVEGYAVGGGLELCLSCDLIVAASSAKLGLPEVRNGVVAIGGGLFRLPRRMPHHLAMELALTGDIREAAYFHQQGVVNQLSSPGCALQDALALAQRLVQNSPLALAASKAVVQAASEQTEAALWDGQMALVAKAFQSEDRQEGLRAFAEKRKPVWSGR